MNQMYEKIILNHLLDKYEKSVLSKNGSQRHLQIKEKILKLFPRFENSDYYQEYVSITHACVTLEKQKLIQLKYVKEDLTEVILMIENIQNGYKYIHRDNPEAHRKEMLDYLIKKECSIQWISKFKEDMISKLNEYKSIQRYLSMSDKEETEDIFKVLEMLEVQQNEISFRKFSLTVLKDSKRLEAIQGKITNIILDYYDQPLENEEEIFSNFNIIKNPGFLYLSGNMKIKINNQIIDLGQLNSPFSLVTKQIKQLEIIEIKDTRILTIENLTSFYDTELSNTTTIYLGGYHNHLRRELLMKLYAFDTTLDFYHFGDIDAGGFYIYRHLKNKTKIPFKTLRMDKETLIEYQKYSKKLTKNDRNRLSLLKEEENQDVIDYMLENDCKLEQEIVELGDIFYISE